MHHLPRASHRLRRLVDRTGEEPTQSNSHPVFPIFTLSPNLLLITLFHILYYKGTNTPLSHPKNWIQVGTPPTHRTKFDISILHFLIAPLRNHLKQQTFHPFKQLSLNSNTLSFLILSLLQVTA